MLSPDSTASLDGEDDVGEGAVHVLDGGLDVPDGVAADARDPELVLDQIGRAHLVHHRGVALGEALVEDPLHHEVGRGPV
jgi:hypothetical protein